MTSNATVQFEDGFNPTSVSPFPGILIIADDSRVAESYRQKLTGEGFVVTVVIGFDSLQHFWEQIRHDHLTSIILLDVADIRSVDAAVVAAITIKRDNPAQFVAYLADPILHTSGLAGDAIFSRSAAQLPHALRDHFAIAV